MGMALAWPIGGMLTCGDWVPSHSTGGVWPGVSTLFCTTLQMLFATFLSSRQRQWPRPVLLAGYFGLLIAGTI